jgi:hypothetical protein
MSQRRKESERKKQRETGKTTVEYIVTESRRRTKTVGRCATLSSFDALRPQ